MNKRAVAYAVGKLMQVLGVILLIPFGICFYDYSGQSFGFIMRRPEALGFVAAALVSFILGLALSFLTRREQAKQGVREGFGIVTISWIAFAALGSIPFFFYFLSAHQNVTAPVLLECFTDGYFEIMSGFTTTGATILQDVELLPRSLLFWRSLTQWLGGMGIITLAIVIFPAMGISGYQMFKGEVPGPTADRFLPKLGETAKWLWGVYLLLTVLEVLLLLGGGMTIFDALCHTFGTLATGGFSTKNSSIGYFDSSYIEWVIVVFMYLAGVNFLIHYNVLCGNFKPVRNNQELHFYTFTLLAAIIIVTIVLFSSGVQQEERLQAHYNSAGISSGELERNMYEEAGRLDSFYKCFRRAAFQVISITTTTGYTTSNFDLWPNTCRFMLLVLMFWGACAGSTGGGIKMIRVLVSLKTAWREIKKVARPRLVESISVGGAIISGKKIINILVFVCLYLTLFVIMVFLMTIFIPDLTTAIACVAATINNIGPGLSGIGATENYAWIPVPGKWLLIVCMLLGRLEVFTVLVILRPAAWKK